MEAGICERDTRMRSMNGGLVERFELSHAARRAYSSRWRALARPEKACALNNKHTVIAQHPLQGGRARVRRGASLSAITSGSR